MSKNQVAVKENAVMHEWFDIDKALSTEIVTMLPKH